MLVAHMIARFGPLPRGDIESPRGGVAMLSPSGGINGIVADRLADAGVPLAALAPETRAALVVDRAMRGPLECAAIWKTAQRMTDKPVKLGTVSAQSPANLMWNARDSITPRRGARSQRAEDVAEALDRRGKLLAPEP